MEERFGLQAQLRRAAVSVPVRYLVGLAQRLELLDDATATTLTARYTDFIRGLQTRITSLQSRT